MPEDSKTGRKLKALIVRLRKLVYYEARIIGIEPQKVRDALIDELDKGR